jgi:hypothetical protein
MNPQDLELAPHLALRLGASYIIQADQNPTCRLPYMSPRGVEDKIGPRNHLALRSEVSHIYPRTYLRLISFNIGHILLSFKRVV